MAKIHQRLTRGSDSRPAPAHTAGASCSFALSSASSARWISSTSRVSKKGSHVDVIAERLDRYPNFYVEPGARSIAFTRQPAEKVRDFFRKYQDRVLYGTDLITATGAAYDEYPAFQRAKTAEEALKIYRLDYQYYAGTGTVDFYGAEVECLGLPRNILDKFYYGNAQRIIPGLAE